MNAAPISDLLRSKARWVFGPCGVVLLAALLYSGFNAYFWEHAWDDMAITLGFARTLADAGTIAPSPLSDPVEGISSILWMAINAALYALHGNPGALFVQAKLLAILFLLVDIGLVFMVAALCGLSRILAFIAALAFAGCASTVIESVNGMENPLYVSAYCIAFISYFKLPSRLPFAVFLVSSSAMLFLRWEGIWFLMPFMLINGWRFGLRGLFAAQHWIWLGLFLGQTVWRYLAFGDIIPNTIRAKLQPPYLPPPPDDIVDLVLRHLAYLRSEITQVKLFILLAAVTVLLALSLSLLRRVRGRSAANPLRDAMTWPVRLAIAIAIAGGVFAAVTGGNWGHHGRMVFVSLPFLLVAVVWGFVHLAAAIRLAPRVAVIVIAVAATETVASGVRGAYGYLVQNSITVAKMANILPALEAAKQLTGQSPLTVAHPDLGAVILYGENYRIVDTALICNTRLARAGYGAFEHEIFARERPDVIQTHEVWTRIARIAEIERLYTDYTPIFLSGIRLFMRRDLLARIPAARLRRRPFAPDGGSDGYDPQLFWTKRSQRDDFAINRRFGYYWMPVVANARGVQ